MPAEQTAGFVVSDQEGGTFGFPRVLTTDAKAANDYKTKIENAGLDPFFMPAWLFIENGVQVWLPREV